MAAVGYIGYWQQPMVDFRQYKTGTLLLADDDDAEYLPVYEFVYEKDGEVKRYSEDDKLPDETEGWKFVGREEKGFVKNKDSERNAHLKTTDFRIWSENGEEDITESLCGFDKQLILFVPDINSLSMATSWKINKLYDMSKANDTEFFAVVAGSQQAIEEWKDLSSGQYPIYTADDTSIKELVRGNPSLVRLENGVIKWKSALSGLILDDEEDSVEIKTYPIEINKTGRQVMMELSLILLSLLAVLVVASLLRYHYASR